MLDPSDSITKVLSDYKGRTEIAEQSEEDSDHRGGYLDRYR